VEGRVVGAVDADELLLQAFEFALALWPGPLDQGLQLLVYFVQVVLPSLNVLLSLEEEYLLLLVMMLDGLSECILAILEHLN
jgi:hypothetical protein